MTFAPTNPPAEELPAADPPPFVGTTVVDSSVTQGNRLKTQGQLEPNNPVTILQNKIDRHFSEMTNVVHTLRVMADQAEEALNKLRVGF
jgi:hypothetical protein